MSPPRSLTPSWPNLIRWGAIGCLILGIGLRVWAIDRTVFWHDEVLTTIISAGHLLTDIQAQAFTGKLVSPADLMAYLQPDSLPWNAVFSSVLGNPEHPPLYYFLTRLWMGLFGSSVTSMRSLATVFGLGLFPALYWFCWELTRSRAVGWVAIALVSLSPFHVLYAREAREYSLWALLLLVAGACLLRALRLDDRAKTWGDRLRIWWPYSLALALGFYTSLLTVYAAIGHGLYTWLLDRGRLGWRVWSITAAGLAAAIAFLPWAGLLISRWDQAMRLTAWTTAFHEPRKQVLQRFAIQILRGFTDFIPFGPKSWMLVLAFHAIALLAMVLVIRRSPVRTWGFLLTLTVVGTSFLALPDLVDGALRSISTRYWTPTYLGLEVTFAIVLAQELSHPRPLRRSLGAIGATGLLAVGLAASINLSQATSNWAKGISVSLPSFAQRINQTTQPLVIVDGFGYRVGNAIALALRLQPTASLYLMSDFNRASAADVQALQTLLSQPDRPFSSRYILNLTPPLRQVIEAQGQWSIEPVGGDNMAWLDRLQPIGQPAPTIPPKTGA